MKLLDGIIDFLIGFIAGGLFFLALSLAFRTF